MRLKQHNRGFVASTRYRRPLILEGYRYFEDIKEAAIYERKYKHSHGQLKRDIKTGRFIIITERGAAQRALPGGV